MIKDLIKQLWKDKFARIALVVLGVIYFALLFADFIAPYTCLLYTSDAADE